jgi:hypothetical protein
MYMVEGGDVWESGTEGGVTELFIKKAPQAEISYHFPFNMIKSIWKDIELVFYLQTQQSLSYLILIFQLLLVFLVKPCSRQV